MAKNKDKKAPQAEEAAEAGIPKDQQEFTTTERGGHVVYLRRMKVEPNGNKGNRTTVHPLTVRLQRNVKFNPFVECGPNGKNTRFQDLVPKEAWEALTEKAEDRTSPVCYWDERPMTEEQSEHAKALKAANLRADEQAEANAKLRKVIEENGLTVPEDI